MSISNNYVPLKELGNGVTTEFSDTWRILSASYIEVFLEDVTTGVQTLVDQGGAADEYTVEFDEGGFVVTFNTAPTSAYYVVIGRSVEIDQNTPYKTSKGFQGYVTENSFDKLTAIDQDQQDEINRAIKFPLGSSANGALPVPVDDKPIGWDGIDGSIKNGSMTFTQIQSTINSVAGLVAGSGVKVSSNDTTVGFLNGKLVAGDAIGFTENNNGGDETLTIAVSNNGVSNTKLAQMPTLTIKGNDTGGTANAKDLTVAEALALLDVYTQAETDAAIAAGNTVVQRVSTSDATVTTTTTIIPSDNTIPQNTEGAEVITLVITPTSATNKLVIHGVINLSATANGRLTAALFQDSTAGALSAGGNFLSSTGAISQAHVYYEMVAGTTSATTFKIRGGNSAAGTVTFNGESGSRIWGGVLAHSLEIEEYAV